MPSFSRSTAVVALTVLVIAGVPTPVVAHGNYLSVDSQVSDDGTVRIEGAVLITTGYVVIHADAGGESGKILGHVKPEKNVFHGNLSVSLEESYWAKVSRTTEIWAVLHYDQNNNGVFDPASDPPIGGAADPDWARRVTISKGDRPGYVLAETEHAQRTNESKVVIQRAHLPEDGYLVVSSNVNGSPGEVVGAKSLPAGVHKDVTVSLDEHYYHHQSEQFSLWAVIYRSNGDDTFGEGDEPVLVNGTPVASQFDVERTDDLEAEHTHTRTSNKVTTSVSETPTVTTSATHSGHDHEHEESTTETALPTSVATTKSDTEPNIDTPTSSPGQPGLGMVATALAVLLVAVIVSRRNR